MGKGYVIDPTELYLATQAVRQGLIQDIDVVMLVGDYHNGFLSLYVPFGSLGVLAFIAFLVSAWRVLYRNFRFGDGALRTINTLLFAYFITRIVFFVVVFGAISNDLAQFVGLVGLSVALNGGVRRAPATATELQTAPIPLALAEQPAS